MIRCGYAERVSTFLTVALLAVLTTVGLVGAVASDGAASLVWAVGTVVVAGVLAWRLRSAPPGAALIAAFVTGILLVSAGLPAAIMLTEGREAASRSGEGGSGGGPSASPVRDPSAELRRALDKADQLMPGGANSILSIDIDENSTQVYVLDLNTGERVGANYSVSSSRWYDPNRTPVNDRAEATFRRSDLAGLDLTSAAAKATAAADRLGIDRSREHASDGIEIDRRYQDRKLIVEFDMSGEQVETDASGDLPDTLTLANVDGIFAVGATLLRNAGIDPAQPVLTGAQYRSYASSATALSNHDRGELTLTVQGGGRTGSITAEAGKFPVVDLRPSTGSSTNSFAFAALTADVVERIRADLEQRQQVLPVDARAVSFQVERDTSWESLRARTAPPIIQFGLGPAAKAYYKLDGTYLRTERR